MLLLSPAEATLRVIPMDRIELASDQSPELPVAEIRRILRESRSALDAGHVPWSRVGPLVHAAHSTLNKSMKLGYRHAKDCAESGLLAAHRITAARLMYEPVGSVPLADFGLAVAALERSVNHLDDPSGDDDDAIRSNDLPY